MTETRRHLAPLLIAPLLTLATACGSSANASGPWDGTKLDQSAWEACTAFAEDMRDGYDNHAVTAQRVTDHAQDSDVRAITDAAAGLERTADGAESGWQVAADTFATVCMDNGWTGE